MADNGYAKAVLVSTDWIAGHLDDPNVVVAEVDENPALYEEGHIPGAAYACWYLKIYGCATTAPSSRPTSCGSSTRAGA